MSKARVAVLEVFSGHLSVTAAAHAYGLPDNTYTASSSATARAAWRLSMRGHDGQPAIPARYPNEVIVARPFRAVP